MSDIKCFNCLKLDNELQTVNNRLSKVIMLAAQVTEQNKNLLILIDQLKAEKVDKPDIVLVN